MRGTTHHRHLQPQPSRIRLRQGFAAEGKVVVEEEVEAKVGKMEELLVEEERQRPTGEVRVNRTMRRLVGKRPGRVEKRRMVWRLGITPLCRSQSSRLSLRQK